MYVQNAGAEAGGTSVVGAIQTAARARGSSRVETSRCSRTNAVGETTSMPMGCFLPICRSDRSAAAIERSEARLAASAKALPTRILAGELERQGWILIPPEGYTPEP